MNILQKVTNLEGISKCVSIRSMSAQVQALNQQEDHHHNKFKEEWESAKPYKQIPGPAGFSAFRAFLPGGKYYKIQPIDMFRLMHEEYGPVYKLRGMLGKPDIVVLHDPKDFEMVYRTEGIWPKRMRQDYIDNFRKNSDKDYYKSTLGLAVEQGESWGRTRSIVNPVMMQPRTVTQYIKPIDSICVELLEQMKVIKDPETLELPADFNSVLHRWGLEVSAMIALDARLGLISSTKNPVAEKLILLVKRFFQLMYELEMKPNFSKYFATPTYKEMMKVQAELESIAVGYVEKALKRLEEEGGSNKPEHEKSILERLLQVDRGIALVMATDTIAAGVDTTTSALISCIYLLAKNPKKQNKLFEELKTIMPTKDSPLTKENMANLPYLRACIKEALRIHSVTAGGSRLTSQDLVLSGYQIPKDTVVLMPLHMLQTHEKHFKKPKEFIPERFLRDQTENTECPSAKNTNPFVYLPFGFGPRMCVGKRIASMEIEIALCRILRNFHVEYHHKDLVYEAHIFNVPKGEFKFKLIDVKD